MAISNQVSLPGATHLNAAARKDKPEVKWLGRTVHEAISGASVDRFFAIIGVIVFLAGLILLPFDLALGITLAPLGGFCAYLGISDLYKGNPLEKALVHLVGSKEKLERLPEVKRTKIDIHPKDGNALIIS